MKAVGRNLIIQKIEEVTTQTEGGLYLSKNDRNDIRYIEANIVSIGDEVEGLKKDNKIFYDRHAGHQIEIDNKIYHVIKAQDVVVVL
jgi:co-chaperonin GroES (HSP10)|tara:strand:- start:559 stop:819 length:261 start_codon:yes stop_codon:yes gene_type:complete